MEFWVGHVCMCLYEMVREAFPERTEREKGAVSRGRIFHLPEMVMTALIMGDRY